MSTNRTVAVLKQTVIGWASQLTTIAREFAPIHIKEYIHSKVEEKGDGTFAISVGVNLQENPLPHGGSLDARAQEYGQPPHPINAVNQPLLRFYWEAAGSWFVGPHVDHPGHAPYHGVGYLRPAITEVLAMGKDNLREQLRESIMGDIYESFKGGG